MKGFGVREGGCERGYVLAENMYRIFACFKFGVIEA